MYIIYIFKIKISTNPAVLKIITYDLYLYYTCVPHIIIYNDILLLFSFFIIWIAGLPGLPGLLMDYSRID